MLNLVSGSQIFKASDNFSRGKKSVLFRLFSYNIAKSLELILCSVVDCVRISDFSISSYAASTILAFQGNQVLFPLMSRPNRE
ncbi:hypothetical protein HI914_01992 [Erysiphe necator]|nr:hypothetical protein HI914_01992 [Erysiphe necator]